MAFAILSTAMVTSCVSNVLITKLTSKAGNSIYNYLFKKNENTIHIPIDEFIQQIDIKEKIIISKAFVESISQKKIKFNHIVTSLQDVIIEVEALLQLIEDKKNKHKNKYFTSYRSLNIKKEHKKLITYDKILSKRLDYLIKLISIS